MLGKFSSIIDSGFLRKFAIVAFAFAFSGCSGYLFEIGEGAWNWTKGPYRTGGFLATSAKERLVVGYYDNNFDGKGTTRIQYCTEPLPDVGTNTSDIAKAIIESKGIKGTVSFQSLSRDLALFERHPVTEFYKAGLFSICQMALGGLLVEGETDKLMNLLITEATQIFIKTLEKEKEKMKVLKISQQRTLIKAQQELIKAQEKLKAQQERDKAKSSKKRLSQRR